MRVTGSRRRLLPVFETYADFRAGVLDAANWIDAVTHICEREGIDPSAPIESASFQDTPVFFVGDALVVKLYGPWKNGAYRAELERKAHAILDRAPALPVPSLIASASLDAPDDDWRYVVLTRMEGVALDVERDAISDTAMVEVAGWMGRTLAAVHTVPLTDGERAQARRSFPRLVTSRHPNTGPAIVGRGLLPAHLAAAVEGWLPSVDELVPEEWPVAFLSNDLKYDHVFGERRDDRFDAHGVIDFNHAKPGYALWDLAYTWRNLISEPRQVRRAFLDAARIPRRDDPDFPRIALGYYLLQDGDAMTYDRSGIEDLDTLDDLAAYWFG